MDEDDPFVPLRPFVGGSLRDRRERERERRIAEHVSRHREHRRQPPGRARGLSLPDIVDTAIAVADAEGTDAVSMRRIAREMRVGAMSLYWYVGSKEELHQLMLEKVQAEAETPEPSGNWRADLRGFARNTRAALLRHPWAIDFLGIGPPSGPNDAHNAERLLAALDGLGLDIATAIQVGMTVGTYVMGAALREIQEIRWQRNATEAMAGMTAAEIAEFRAEYNRRIRVSGRYPHIVKIMDADIDPDAPETRDERFEFGLDCVLDGIAARLEPRQRRLRPAYFHRKCTNRRPKFLESFSTRWYSGLMSLRLSKCPSANVAISG
jgi:AcrR family transcriptional regulator